MNLKEMEVGKKYLVSITSKNPDENESWLESVPCLYIDEENDFWVGAWNDKNWKMTPGQAIAPEEQGRKKKQPTSKVTKTESTHKQPEVKKTPWWKKIKFVWE